jgi:Xaa-Pro dipeptidase
MDSIKRWNIVDIPESEVLARRKKTLDRLQDEHVDAALFFSAEAIYYLIGGALKPTERPMCLILQQNGTATLFVPRLELEHAEHVGKLLDKVACYKEYIGERHPMLILVDLLTEMKLIDKAIAADSDGYPAIFGYRGPKLSSLCPNMSLVLKPYLIEEIQQIKSPFDQAVLRETARWGNYAHALLQEYTVAGKREFEVVDRVKVEATQVMLRALGPDFVTSGLVDAGAMAIYRGQIGLNSYFPHVVANNAEFKEGDNLVTGACAFMLGCRTELERTMFVGEPSPVQRKFFNHVTEAQQVALEAIKPGKKCADVDKEVYRYYKENGLEECWRHHTGHSIGFRGHEQPFLDSYDETGIQPGMVLTVEPGLYVKGVGGFRFSDTILVTETGIEMLTYYPKKLDQLICRVK